MSEKLNDLLKHAYYRYLNDEDPPINPNDIKKFLLLEGTDLDDEKFNEESSRLLLKLKNYRGDDKHARSKK